MKGMNRSLRPIATSLLLCLCSVYAWADRVIYNYDASGNRTRARKEILLRGEHSPEDDSQPRHESLSLRRVTIYPNPTEGELIIEITGGDSFEGASITIYAASGGIVYYNEEINTVNKIDLTPCPRGMYLIMIRIDGETSSWKIIKI